MIDHFKINDKKTYSVTMKSDIKTCSISSACTLDDGTIILADYNNNKIKRLDSSSFAVRDCYYVPENPIQVCAISNQEIASNLWVEPADTISFYCEYNPENKED